MSVWEERSFLAGPGQVEDWRLVVLHHAAEEAGLLAALPATPAELAGRLSLDEHAVSVVLEALAAWQVVTPSGDGGWALGPEAPTPDAALVLGHHARSLRRWSTSLEDRLHGRTPSPAPVDPGAVTKMLDALVVNARESAPGTVDACMTRAPGARRALDLGGGHGEYARELARRGLSVTMQDQVQVIDAARRDGRLSTAGIDLFAGDLFEVLAPGPFDLILCAGVSYTLDVARNLELYRRALSVLVPGGVLAVHTFLRDSDFRSAVFAVQMLVAGRGGDTHGEVEHRRWAAEAGFVDIEVHRLEREPEWIVFGRRNASG